MSNELKNDIRFIAVGAAGANVVKMLERKDYKSYYINLAKQDLDLIDSPNKLHISNGEGASKDRNKAKAVLAESVDDVMNTLDNQITEQYIFVVYSLAGGTGSGLGTFLASVIAENPNKKVGLVIILPSMNESLQARINTYEALSEIIEIKNELCSIFILDNNQREDKFSINRSFANLFEAYINVANNTSIRGVIDIAEQKKLLETPGIAMIHKATGTKEDLLSTINEGIYVPLEPNKRVKYIGLSQPDTKDTIDVADVINVVGEPIDYYCGYGKTEDIVLYLAGLSFPKTFINKLAESIKAEQDRVKKVMEDDDLSMDMNINFLATKPVEKPQKPKSTMRDRLVASITK